MDVVAMTYRNAQLVRLEAVIDRMTATTNALDLLSLTAQARAIACTLEAIEAPALLPTSAILATLARR